MRSASRSWNSGPFVVAGLVAGCYFLPPPTECIVTLLSVAALVPLIACVAPFHQELWATRRDSLTWICLATIGVTQLVLAGFGARS